MEIREAAKAGTLQFSAIARPETMTLINGAPVPNDTNSLVAGQEGPQVIMDTHFLQKMAAFNRAPVPQRPVHGRGFGAFGTFTVTNDITQHCKADIFSEVGKKTEAVVRFSNATADIGEPDTQRDIHGFAVKFYTKEGNWDLVANHVPVFFVRDTIKFPDVMRAMKRDPRNNDRSPITMWDFFSLHPESLHAVTMLFTDRGTPMSMRHMHGFGANTFSMINKTSERVYCKFHLISQQGIKNLNRIQTVLLAGQDPEHYLRDLYESIQMNNFPRWKLCVQILPEAKAATYPFAFDTSKVWYHKDFPLIEVGELELNKNPLNFHAEIEQVAFSPSNVPPGISFSPDRLLQGRLFAYDDAQRYRIGVNFPLLPVNYPHGTMLNVNQNGGLMYPTVDYKFPNYSPSSLPGVLKKNPVYSEPPMRILPEGSNLVDRIPLDKDADFYEQPRKLFNLLPEDEKLRLADNIATSMETVPSSIVDRMLTLFFNCSEEYGKLVKANLDARKLGNLQRTEAEWVKSATLQILQKNEPDTMPPVGTVPAWPEKFQKFEIHSSLESENVPQTST